MQDDACPNYCKSVGDAVVPCSDGTWCCSVAGIDGIGDTSCCTNADQTFRLDWGALFLPARNTDDDDDAADDAAYGSRLTNNRLAPRATTTVSTAATSSTSSISTNGVLLATQADDDDTDTNSKKCPPDRSAIVGLSAGVPLGACLLAALAAIFVLLGRDRKARDRIRALTESAREERERVAREHIVPRVYAASYHAPTSLGTPSVSRFGHNHSGSVVGSSPILTGPSPQTPEGRQDGFEGFDGYVDEGGLVPGGEGGHHGGARHVSWATSAGGGSRVAGTHESWTTGGGSSSWAYEYDNEPHGSRKERFEMTP
ncbi:uncharacterized protein BKCO1_5200055 [Diplodia corticola]|uniref:Uncharacterized protein n=1 Tax=Diplodia corticola TaxID=236234 RepID=A0A1J9REY7_9PEZI|nr:uncharacterized protein BKCO1_5200055 [Diplodia corticola]OJD31131.1 hypothetical protein BKCO1_5200055 [Diplodia corticola]